MKLKLIFSPFGWTVPSWKVSRISRCFRWMLVPLHNATPCHAPGHQKYCGQWSWNVGPKDTQECCCLFFADVRWSDSWGFFQSHRCKEFEVGIGGRIWNRQDSRNDKWNGSHSIQDSFRASTKTMGAIHWNKIPTGPTGKRGPPQKGRFLETFPVGPNRSIEFWTEISGKVWLNGSRPIPPKELRSCSLVSGKISALVSQTCQTSFRGETPQQCWLAWKRKFATQALISPGNDVWEVRIELRNSISMTLSLPTYGYCFWLVENLQKPSGSWLTGHQDGIFLRSFLRRHLAGKPVMAMSSGNVSCLHGLHHVTEPTWNARANNRLHNLKKLQTCREIHTFLSKFSSFWTVVDNWLDQHQTWGFAKPGLDDLIKYGARSIQPRVKV